MKNLATRLAITIAIFALITATALTAVQRSRMKHPVSGQEITIPGRDGDGMLLPDGWRVTPAGRQLESGDMILSTQVSPDGKLLAFTNSGYTRHEFHIFDLSTEKEIATFPLDRAWSGLAWSSNGKRVLISAGAGNVAADIYTFQRWDDGSWTQRQSVQLEGIERAKKGGKNGGPKSAVSSIVVSPDGGLCMGSTTPTGISTRWMAQAGGRARS